MGGFHSNYLTQALRIKWDTLHGTLQEVIDKRQIDRATPTKNTDETAMTKMKLHIRNINVFTRTYRSLGGVRSKYLTQALQIK